MWTYNHIDDHAELTHYGVPGMRWGVRRSSSQLQARVGKLEKKNKQIEKKNVTDYRVRATRSAANATRIRNQGERKELRARNYRDFKKAKKLKIRAGDLQVRADRFENKIAKGEKRIYKNKKKISILNNTIKDMDKATIEEGKKYTSGVLMRYSKGD